MWSPSHAMWLMLWSPPACCLNEMDNMIEYDHNKEKSNHLKSFELIIHGMPQCRANWALLATVRPTSLSSSLKGKNRPGLTWIDGLRVQPFRTIRVSKSRTDIIRTKFKLKTQNLDLDQPNKGPDPNIKPAQISTHICMHLMKFSPMGVCTGDDAGFLISTLHKSGPHWIKGSLKPHRASVLDFL